MTRRQHLRLDKTSDEEARIDGFVCAVTSSKRDRELHFGPDSAGKRPFLTEQGSITVTESADTATSVRSAQISASSWSLPTAWVDLSAALEVFSFLVDCLGRIGLLCDVFDQHPQAYCVEK